MDCQEENCCDISDRVNFGSEMFKAKLPKYYRWTPQDDITTLELAKCLPAFNVRDICQLELLVESLPENCRRHFTEVGE